MQDAVRQARDQLSKGNAAEAAELLTSYVRGHPADPSAWSLLGAAYFELRDWFKAEQATERAVKVQPSAREWCNLGTIYRKRGKLRQAVAAQKRALSLDRNYKRARGELRKLESQSFDDEPVEHANAVMCHVCGERRGELQCGCCRRLVCSACIDQQELCRTCSGIENLARGDWQPLWALAAVSSLEPALARRQPKCLAGKVNSLLARADGTVSALRAEGSEEAAARLQWAFDKAKRHWRVESPPPPPPPPVHATVIPLSQQTQEQAHVCREVLGTMQVRPCSDRRLAQHCSDAARAASLPAPRVWMSPQYAPNACAIGFTASDSHVVFTEGITQLLPQTELRAVAAHEVAHIARADSVRNTALAAQALGIVAAGAVIGSAVELGFLLDGDPSNDFVGMLIGMGIQALATGAAASNLSRELKQAEFAADAHGSALLRCHGDLSQGLARMQAAQRADGWSGIPMAETSHMFIVPTGYSFAVSNVQTHPATGDRQFALTVIEQYGG